MHTHVAVQYGPAPSPAGICAERSPPSGLPVVMRQAANGRKFTEGFSIDPMHVTTAVSENCLGSFVAIDTPHTDPGLFCIEGVKIATTVPLQGMNMGYTAEAACT